MAGARDGQAAAPGCCARRRASPAGPTRRWSRRTRSTTCRPCSPRSSGGTPTAACRPGCRSSSAASRRAARRARAAAAGEPSPAHARDDRRGRPRPARRHRRRTRCTTRPVPDDGWLALYRSERGPLPPAASQVLTNHPDVVFASVRDGETCVAVARVAVDGRWAGLFARRGRPRAPPARARLRRCQRGACAGRSHRGARRVYLQVRSDNDAGACGCRSASASRTTTTTSTGRDLSGRHAATCA